MKKNAFYFLIILAITLIFQSCKKSDDPSPGLSEAKLTGAWTFSSQSGSVKDNGQTVTVSKNGDFDFSTPSSLEFKTGGGLQYEGKTSTYSISENRLVIKDPNYQIYVRPIASLDGNTLTLKYDDTAISELKSLYSILGSEVTDVNVTVVYKK